MTAHQIIFAIWVGVGAILASGVVVTSYRPIPTWVFRSILSIAVIGGIAMLAIEIWHHNA